MILSLLAIGVASAQDGGFGAARLSSGTPEFESCLSDEGGCVDNFFRFLTESMREQGFAMQNHSQSTSALINQGSGVLVGGSIGTFPFEPEAVNLSGKVENTSYSPVFPRLSLGWLGGEERRYAAGAFFTPPIPVGGAQALQLGAEGGVSFAPAGAGGWGIEGDVTYLRATAPIVASEEQFDERENFSNPDNLDPDTYAAVCGDAGCLDTFSMAVVGVRAGHAWVLPSGLVPYAKGGVALARERLDVEYDATSWTITAVQPSVHGGVGWNLGEHAHLAAGTSLALQQSNQSEANRPGVFFKLDAAAAWAF